MKSYRRKPKQSLRTILITWFLLLSILPLAFVTGYSLIKFERAIDREMLQRLSGNAKDIDTILGDYLSLLNQRRDKFAEDPHLSYRLLFNEAESLTNQGMMWLKQGPTSSFSFFNRQGRLIVTVFQDGKGQSRSLIPPQDAVFLAERYMQHLEKEGEIALIKTGEGQKISLVLISRVKNQKKRIVGYVEQVIEIGPSFLRRLKDRMKLELMIVKENGQTTLATNPKLLSVPKDFIREVITQKNDSFFDIELKDTPYGLFFYPLQWGESRIWVALGASKSETKAVLRTVNLAFVTVVGTVIIFLIIISFVISSWVLKPLNELVDALQSFESQEQAVTIPVKNQTEIGLLTESFNQMFKKIWQARADLRKKVFELQNANRELKETQTRLVHSAKMVSLGQLVAGVAHELNNPIGFIFANMTHMRDYSEKLIQLIRIAETEPQKLAKAKDELEFDYIVQDFPKLIASCEDGARRTKDIVLGLRNFSRLEEAKLSGIDIVQSLEATLDLLQGEIKGRIQIFKNYDPIPKIHGYPTQINQVFMNVLSNAVQAIEGQGQIWITTLFLKDRRYKDGRVQISIQDSGKGMPPEVIEKIFDPFFTTKGVGQGTGLGLSISYGIIESHGGEIQVRSEIGVGTEFIIILPVKPPTTKSTLEKPSAPS
ncbi:MAG: ATP-binding protein [Bdellovibrionales bacterium]